MDHVAKIQISDMWIFSIGKYVYTVKRYIVWIISLWEYWLDTLHQIFYFCALIVQNNKACSFLTIITVSFLGQLWNNIKTIIRKGSDTVEVGNISLAFRPIKLDSEILAKSFYLRSLWVSPITNLFLHIQPGA